MPTWASVGLRTVGPRKPPASVRGFPVALKGISDGLRRPKPVNLEEDILLLERVFFWYGGNSVGRKKSSVGLTEPSVGLSGSILGPRGVKWF